jgi:Protein of unknown function (DUF3499)
MQRRWRFNLLRLRKASDRQPAEAALVALTWAFLAFRPGREPGRPREPLSPWAADEPTVTFATAQPDGRAQLSGCWLRVAVKTRRRPEGQRNFGSPRVRSRRMNTGSCSRPACSGEPAAWLAYDYGARCAWVDYQREAPSDRSSHWPLCERHADTLSVPKGWSRVDRRSPSRGSGSPVGAGLDGEGFEGRDLDGGTSGDEGLFSMSEVCSRIH